jgi:hypothetical protein
VKAWLEVGGAAFSLAGVLVGVYGTFVMTKFYHPYGPVGFVVSMARMLGRLIIGQSKRNQEHSDVAAAFAELTPEKKGESLTGAHWLFIGFFLQTIGAFLIVADAWIVNCRPHWLD